MESLRDLLEFGVEVAWRSGRATLAHFQTSAVAETKPDDSPVTLADREAERIARELIEARFPHDGILGEELGVLRPEARRRWVIDPIDGTRSYVRGVALYGVLLALEDEGEAVLGVIHLPALGETVYAARGEGCWCDGRRALVSGVTELGRALILTSDAETIETQGRAAGWNRLRGRAGTCRTWGDCYGYALVATGRAEAMLDPVVSLWDTAPMAPIIEEAGGVLTDWGGSSTYKGGSLVATNAALAREIRDLLTEGA